MILGKFPISVDVVDDWWLVAAGQDWLIELNGNWPTSIVAPELGRNAVRVEVLLTGLTEALFTTVAGRTTFMVGDEALGSEALWTRVSSMMRDNCMVG